MRRYDLWTSLTLLIVGVVVSYESLRLGFGTWKVPGAGFLPFWAGLGLCSCSMIIFLITILKREGEGHAGERFWPRADSRKIVLIVLLSMIVYNLVWTTLGFPLSTFVFTGFLFRFIGRRRWWTTIAGAVLTFLASYVLFGFFLECQLPRGIIGF